jgi:hypothetical protein
MGSGTSGVIKILDLAVLDLLNLMWVDMLVTDIINNQYKTLIQVNVEDALSNH